MPDEQRRNKYEDADMERIILEIETLEDEKSKILAEARGRASGVARRIEDAKKTATKLEIPAALLKTLRKQRKLERELEANAAELPDNLAEMYEEASGQFSWLKPVEGEKATNVVNMAAQKRSKAAKANEAKEQAEGAALVDKVLN